MTTPLADFLRLYAGADWTRLHMPGHKGRLDGPLAGAALFDITEIAGADSLFECDGILRQSEDNAAALQQANDAVIFEFYTPHIRY